MNVLPVDLTAIVAIIMGVSVVLIPVAGLTARFALKPLVDSFAKFWESKGMEESLAIAERRIALLEQQVEGMDHQLRRIEETQAFDRQLGAGAAPARTIEGGEAPR